MGNGPTGTDSTQIPDIGASVPDDSGTGIGSTIGGVMQDTINDVADTIDPREDKPDNTEAFRALMNQYPRFAEEIKKMMNLGYDLNKVTRIIEKWVERRQNQNEKKDKYDPLANSWANSYFDIWGEEIPESEIEYAKSEGLNAYEFVAYQRSKSAFTSTELYERESTGLAGMLAQAFGMGGMYSGDTSPFKGTGAPQ